MKRFFAILAVLVATTVASALAQETAVLEERVKRLSGYVQDLQEDNANQKRQIESLVREIQSLREQVQNVPKTSSASNEDLRELAKKVQEIDEKRKADYALIAKEIKDLGKVAAAASSVRPTQTPRANSGSADKPMADLPKEAIEHTVASGDTLSTIAAAYSKERGGKVTTELILKANPKVDPRKLQVGQKILIPLP